MRDEKTYYKVNGQIARRLRCPNGEDFCEACRNGKIWVSSGYFGTHINPNDYEKGHSIATIHDKVQVMYPKPLESSLPVVIEPEMIPGNTAKKDPPKIEEAINLFDALEKAQNLIEEYGYSYKEAASSYDLEEVALREFVRYQVPEPVQEEMAPSEQEVKIMGLFTIVACLTYAPLMLGVMFFPVLPVVYFATQFGLWTLAITGPLSGIYIVLSVMLHEWMTEQIEKVGMFCARNGWITTIEVMGGVFGLLSCGLGLVFPATGIIMALSFLMIVMGAIAWDDPKVPIGNRGKQKQLR